MKKLLCILLNILMIFATLTFVGCKKDAPALKIGLGVYTTVSATSADGEVDGQGKATVTVATVLVDADGKVVSCQLDVADNTVKYTAEGKPMVYYGLKTKYEQGTDYNMKAYGGAAKEWFEQADAFEGVVAGKTLNEIKSLVAAENKGTDEVINAGCTIMVNEFVNAVEKAITNAVDSAATAESTLKLGVYTEQTCKDAEEEKDGQSKLETTVFAAALDADGKIVAALSDCVQVTFTFDTKGASTFDSTKPVISKRDAGDSYGMKAYGGAAKEWHEQADAFNTACIGKTPKEVASLMANDNYGNADVKASGCTILVNGFVKAAEKIG